MDKILVLSNSYHKKHNPDFEISDMAIRKYYECPERIDNIGEALINSDIEATFKKIDIEDYNEEDLKNTHTKDLIDTIKTISESVEENKYAIPDTFTPRTYSNNKSKDYKNISYHCIDTSTAIGKNTYNAALISAAIAFNGTYPIIQKKENIIYGLCRPPGHHAGTNIYGGYCFFNNAAIAANNFVKSGKVAIFDIDYHHGNGTQDIFYDTDSVLYVSIHADPYFEYPFFSGYKDETGQGSGLNCNLNIPLPFGTDENNYLKAMNKACEKIISFRPDFLIISLGLDTYKNDPICSFKLELDTFKRMGEKIRKLNFPTLVLQEGGYHLEDLGKLAVRFLTGILTD